MKRVLLVSYTFPPVGGAGVQRVAKFTKYLPRHGWLVSVLTATNPSVPLFDDSLCAEIPPDTHIERASTWEPSYKIKAKVAAGNQHQSSSGIGRRIKSLIHTSVNALLQPDPQILWAPNAIRSGRRLLGSTPHQAVLATGPPFSAFLIGARISRSLRLPLVLDYRDEWDISNAYWKNRTARWLFHQRQQRLQAKLLWQASAVLATTESSADQIRSIARAAGSSAPIHCVYNGYDPDDFSCLPAPSTRSKYRITYIGTLHSGHYPSGGLTSIEPLIQAVLRLEQLDPQATKRLEIVLAGRRTEDQETSLRRLDATGCQVVRHGYLPHDDALRLMNDSDRLCILLTDTPDAIRVVPGKLFEYLATGRPLLTIAPQGEVWNILKHHPDAGLHAPNDVDSITRTLQQLTRSDMNHIFEPVRFDASSFSRNGQAAQLAEVLDSITGGK